jgi:hypothetical protein
MFVMREVLRCKPGKIGELTKKFQALNAVVKRRDFPGFTIMTDVAGDFWTLVLQFEADSLEAFFAMEEQVMADAEARQVMAGYHDLVLSGNREVFRKVA